jgi:hypothetical protein
LFLLEFRDNSHVEVFCPDIECDDLVEVLDAELDVLEDLNRFVLEIDATEDFCTFCSS